MEEDSNSSQTEEYQETEPQNYSKFSKSLQELKDLCSQLHAAAGYCESTFLNSNHKHLVLENTKEYVCKAVVAVVDHLGSVSANLDQHISETTLDRISQTEVKLDFYTQKLFLCQEYSDKLALAKLTRSGNTPRYNSRYVDQNKSLRETESKIVASTVNDKHRLRIDEQVPVFFYPCINKSSSSSRKGEKAIDSSSLSEFPVRDNLSVQSKPQALSLQLQDKRKTRRGALFGKSMTSNEILSIIRRRKRHLLSN